MLLPPGPSPRPRPGSSDAQATRSDRVGRARHGVAIPARLAATAAALAALLASPARAQTVNPALFITNGQVTAQALRDSTLYIGGSFTFVGPVTGAGVPVDSVSALPGPGFPRVNGVVLAAVPDGAGGWFIGGQFTAVDGSLRSNLAHVLADFTVAAWDPGASGIVRALVLRGGTLFVGGDFLTLGGAARNRIGAVDTSTALATAWNPNANSSVRAFAPGTSALYVGGQFTTIGGLARNRIAALDYVTGAASAAWNPNANGTVLSLSLDPASNLLYAGGQFTFFDVLRRNRIAQIDAPTGTV